MSINILGTGEILLDDVLDDGYKIGIKCFIIPPEGMGASTILMKPYKGTIQGRLYVEQDVGIDISVDFDASFLSKEIFNRVLNDLCRDAKQA